MAKKKFDWNMVTVRLDKSDQKKVHQVATKQEIDWHAAATALGGLGYKISMTWVDDRLAWVVTATGQVDHAINPASSISSWSQDPEEALILTWYKVCVVFDGGEWVSDNDDIPWG